MMYTVYKVKNEMGNKKLNATEEDFCMQFTYISNIKNLKINKYKNIYYIMQTEGPG